jgi:branched-chain amino acid transport system permease protein
MSQFLDVLGVYDFATRQALILTLVGMSIYVLLKAGIFAVPQIGFMAIGSYTSALLMLRQGWPFPLALLAAALAGGVFGLVIGVLLIRVSGIYLALASIGLSEMVRIAIINVDFTGGPQGIYGVPITATDPWIVAVVVVAMVFLARLAGSRFGSAMVMMREDPLIARHVGISVARYRIALFGLSGVLAGLGGSLFVHFSGFVDPSQYSFDLLTEVLATVIIGGMAYVFGPAVGSIVIFGLPLLFTGLVEYSAIVNGVLIVIVIAVADDGIVGLLGRARRAIRSRVGGSDPRPVGSAPLADDVSDEDLPSAQVLEIGRSPVLAAHDVRKAFGGITALNGVTLEVHEREVLGVIGPNGSGKTSLLNVLSGAYRPDTATGTLAGRDLAALWGKPQRLAGLGMSRTFQGIRLVQNVSVRENLAMGAVGAQGSRFVEAMLGLPRARRDRRAVERRTAKVLDELGLGEVADARVGSLPYGAQRKVEIARALMSEPVVLMLDEPTAGMTPVERDEIFELVGTLRARGLAIIVVEHDVEVMVRHCDRMVVLNFGVEIAAGTPDSVMREEAVIDAYIGTAS